MSRPFVLAGTEVEVGISIGVAHATGEPGEPGEAVLERTDHELYRDKVGHQRRATDPR